MSKLLSSLSFLFLSLGLIGQTALSDGLNIGAQYRAGLTYDDDKLNDNDSGDNASSQTNIDVEFLRLIGKASPAKNVSFLLWYNALAAGDGVQIANLKWRYNDMLSLSVGRNKTREGGWNFRDAGYSTVAGTNFYFAHKPFGLWTDSVVFHIALAGEISIHFLDDVVATSDEDGVVQSGYKNTKAKQPANIVEWLGKFGAWMPLIQIGSYDLNNSMFYSAGIKGNVGAIGLKLDYTSDSRKNFARDDAGNMTGTDTTDTYTSANLAASYMINTSKVTFEYQHFDVKQDDDLDANPTAGQFSDNGNRIALGLNCQSFGKGYEPYAWIIRDAGKFDKASGDGTEDLSRMKLKVGVMGKF